MKTFKYWAIYIMGVVNGCIIWSDLSTFWVILFGGISGIVIGIISEKDK